MSRERRAMRAQRRRLQEIHGPEEHDRPVVSDREGVREGQVHGRYRSGQVGFVLRGDGGLVRGEKCATRAHTISIIAFLLLRVPPKLLRLICATFPVWRNVGTRR